MVLIFATNNKHKIEEIASALPKELSIITLAEAGIDIDIPEPHDTLEDNAAEKARTIFQMTSVNCFSEDTGLEVFALNNQPGVHSARYAGDEKSYEKNNKKLLSNLDGILDRKARFRTVICLIIEGNEYFFEGVCEGKINHAPVGQAGFGYDPLFIPNGSKKTFAEMDLKEKNLFSHRKKALDMLVAFLNNIQVNKEY